tara:strand:+ start:104 stop:298 length:195 start_codon:yes stop_codon:yes gene_type:complete
MLIKKAPKISINILFFDFSVSFDQKYIEKNIIKGTLNPISIYLGIIINIQEIEFHFRFLRKNKS